MMTQTAPPLVAVIDGDAPFLALMDEVFTLEGYAVVTARHPAEAPALLRAASLDLLLLDLVLGRTLTDGLALLRALRIDDPSLALPVIVTSTSSDLLRTYGAEFTAPHIATLAKPFDLADLLHLVSALAPRGVDGTKESIYHAHQTPALLPAGRSPSPCQRDLAPRRAAPLARFAVGGAQSGGTARAVAGAGHSTGHIATDAVPRRGNR